MENTTTKKATKRTATKRTAKKKTAAKKASNPVPPKSDEKPSVSQSDKKAQSDIIRKEKIRRRVLGFI